MDFIGCIERGFLDVNYRSDPRKSTPLSLYVSFRKQKQALRLLRIPRVDVDVHDESGLTPLITACHYNMKKVVVALIEHGADVNKISIDGRTALMCCAILGRYDLANILLTKAGADWRVIDREGSSTIDYMQQSPSREIRSMAERLMKRSTAFPSLRRFCWMAIRERPELTNSLPPMVVAIETYGAKEDLNSLNVIPRIKRQRKC